LAQRAPVGARDEVLSRHAQLENQPFGFGERTKRRDHLIQDALTATGSVLSSIFPDSILARSAGR